MAMAASLLLYAAGLLQNDLFDLKEDRRERPNRPLPSGAVTPVAVACVAGLLVAWGVALAFLIGPGVAYIALAICVAVTAYNAGLKRVVVVGPVVMGLCRGLSLLLGAATAWTVGGNASAGLVSAAVEGIKWSVIGLTLYIAIVTMIAAGETRQRRIGPVRFLPFVLTALWLGYLRFVLAPSTSVISLWPVGPAGSTGTMVLTSIAIIVFALLRILQCSIALGGSPAPALVQKTIGRFIRCLILIQAAVAAAAGFMGAPPILSIVAVGALVIAFGLSRVVGWWFYGS